MEAVNSATVNYSLRVPPESRLIPGVPRHPNTSLRKKSSSANLDGRFWVNLAADTDPTENSEPSPTLADAVLPHPVASGRLPEVAAQVAMDFLLVSVSFIAITVLSSTARPPIALARMAPPSSAALILLYGALMTLLGHSEGLYRSHQRIRFGDASVILGKAVAWSTLLIIAMGYCAGAPGLIRSTTVLACAPLNYFGMLAWREWYWRLAARRSRTGKGSRNVLIVGAGQLGREIAAHLRREDGARNVLGFLDESMPPDGEVRGRISDLSRVARAEFVDEIILTIPHEREVARRVIREARLNRLDVKVAPDLLGFHWHNYALETCGRIPVLTLHEEPIPVFGLLAKRSLDMVLSNVALLACAPVLAGIALLIKLDSPGPVLYRAERVGKKGRRFVCLKFRTMSVDADAQKQRLRAANEREGPFFKMRDDPRVTRIGRWLRRYSLDELPQLWNVVRGEMSLVGPRPHALDDFQNYQLQDFRRLDVTPGLTGLWQVTARGNPSFQQNMALDLEYIETWRLMSDLKILWKTLGVVLSGSGV